MKGLMKNISGQSLFEIVVAIAIIALITVAIVGLATISVRNSSFSEEKTSANFYTQEVVEWLRQYRDEQGWVVFSQKVLPGVPLEGQVWCFPTVSDSDWDSNTTPDNCDSEAYIDGTKYLREVTLIDGDEVDTIDVDVSVYWEDSRGIHNASISTIFSKWEASP